MKPELRYACADRDTVRIDYSVALNDQAPPPPGAFQVRVDGALVAVTGVEIVPTPGHFELDGVRLTLAHPVIDGQIVTLSYIDPTPGDDAAAVQDAGGDDAASFSDFWIPNVTDQISPTVAITVDDPMLLAGETARVTLTFSERPSNFDPASVIVTNGVLTGLAPGADRNVFTGTFTPTGDGRCTIEVAAGSYMDSTHTPGAGGRVDFSAEVSVPTVTETVQDNLLAAGEDAVVTLTFSEAPVGFDIGDLRVVNGSILSLSATANPLVYTAICRPSAEGWVRVLVAGGEYTDAAGNPGASALVDMTADFRAPRGSVVIDYDGVLVAGQTVPVQFFFNEDPGASFTLSDVVVDNGVLTGFTQTYPGQYTAQLAAIGDGQVRVTIPDGSFTDAAGNPGLGRSASVMADATQPSVTVSVDDQTLGSGQAAHVTFSFSEAPTGFTAADVTATNGAISGFAATADATVYTAVFTPAGEGAAQIAVAANSYTDSVGNPGLAGAATLSVDLTAPTVTVAISPGRLEDFENGAVTFTFSEAPVGFTAADVSVSRGVISSLSATANPRVYTATFTPTAAGTASVAVTDASYADDHGNPGHAASLTFTVAAPPPPGPPPPPPPPGPTEGPDILRLPETGGTVSAGAGDDWVAGGGASDWMNGNVGQDTLSGGGGADTMMGGRDNDWLQGDGGDDMVFGDLGDDVVHGGPGDDLVQGNAGNDTVMGEEGDDRVYGGKGDDVLSGGDGADWLFGDLGNDVLVGGAGADRFCFPDGAAGRDVITDFSHAEGDVIWIGAGLAATFEVLAAHITAAANGDAVITLGAEVITLSGVAPASLTAADFIFG